MYKRQAYFEENNKITINYIANKGGVVSEGSETLSPATGTAEGSKATASLGYRFVNWTDSEGNEVGTAPEFIPEKVDGAYEGATSVSYTHLDVYKRQILKRMLL